MDTLKNAEYIDYDYNSRYTHVPVYFDTLKNRQIYGIGMNLKQNTSVVSHKVTSRDTLHNLALKYYNNPTYWWIIANFNNIQDAFIRLVDRYSILQIPNITSIEFGRLNE